MSYRPVNEIVQVNQISVGDWIIDDNRLHRVDRMSWNRSLLSYEVKLSGHTEAISMYVDKLVVKVSLAVYMNDL